MRDNHQNIVNITSHTLMLSPLFSIIGDSMLFPLSTQTMSESET